jgi:hypothetical protein
VLGCFSNVEVEGDFRGLELCIVGTVGYSVGSKEGICVNRLGKNGGVKAGREWIRRGRKSSWEGE